MQCLGRDVLMRMSVSFECKTWFLKEVDGSECRMVSCGWKSHLMQFTRLPKGQSI